MTVVNRIQSGDGDPRHGTANGYNNHRCRCQACREAWAETHGEYYTRVLAHPRPRPACGTESAYKHLGCRCDACKRASRDARWRRRWASIDVTRAYERERNRKRNGLA